MGSDIVLAPAGYMALYLTVFAVFAYQFYRVLSGRSARARVEEQNRR